MLLSLKSSATSAIDDVLHQPIYLDPQSVNEACGRPSRKYIDEAEAN